MTILNNYNSHFRRQPVPMYLKLKVKLQQEITGLPIQVFRVGVVNSISANVAVGKKKNTSQSSTFVMASGRTFPHTMQHAVDGDHHDNFSHTNNANPWLEIDLGESISGISLMRILNC